MEPITINPARTEGAEPYTKSRNIRSIHTVDPNFEESAIRSNKALDTLNVVFGPDTLYLNMKDRASQPSQDMGEFQLRENSDERRICDGEKTWIFPRIYENRRIKMTGDEDLRFFTRDTYFYIMNNKCEASFHIDNNKIVFDNPQYGDIDTSTTGLFISRTGVCHEHDDNFYCYIVSIDDKVLFMNHEYTHLNPEVYASMCMNMYLVIYDIHTGLFSKKIYITDYRDIDRKLSTQICQSDGDLYLVIYYNSSRYYSNLCDEIYKYNRETSRFEIFVRFTPYATSYDDDDEIIIWNYSVMMIRKNIIIFNMYRRSTGEMNDYMLDTANNKLYSLATYNTIHRNVIVDIGYRWRYITYISWSRVGNDELELDFSTFYFLSEKDKLKYPNLAPPGETKVSKVRSLSMLSGAAAERSNSSVFVRRPATLPQDAVDLVNYERYNFLKVNI